MNHDSCKKCKFYKRKWTDRLFFIGHEFAICTRITYPEAYRISWKKLFPTLSAPFYSGEEHYSFCSLERQEYLMLDTCGLDAKYFESKK